ncbi:hypothetical protein FRB96_004052 [Tulasnella sp. 330]|nr:hypothetical protein FRB96_004052 [Tulasnella sp. 330]KAG8877926.1 hypothetical protein FRB98_006478 [Tulasnella sp. 332]
MSTSDAQSSTAINKRLIISGVAPSASTADLTARFASFGTVLDAEGIGLLDGNGDSRKFAYLTLETTQQKLTKCINALNGAKWKGSKLRVGEAKPRWNETSHKELQNLKRPLDDQSNTGAGPAQQKKKKKKTTHQHKAASIIIGKRSGDMTVTSLKNVEDRKNWNRTPLDHLIRPLLMRPDHPLPPISTPEAVALPSATKPKGGRKGRKDKTSTTVPTRARRTIIDPTRYGAVHLTAASGMLGAEVVGYHITPKHNSTSNQSSTLESSSLNSSSDDSDDNENEEEVPRALALKAPLRTDAESPDSSKQSKATAAAMAELSSYPMAGTPALSETDPPVPSEDEVVGYNSTERRRDLDIMGSLLDGNDTLAWEPDSDLEELARAQKDTGKSESDSDSDPDPDSETESSPNDDDDARPHQAPAEGKHFENEPAVQMTSLKAMFAPKPDEAGFSIFANLTDADVDLDLEDLDLNEQEPIAQTKSTPVVRSLPPAVETSTLLDPNAPFFFPLPRDENGLVNLPGDNRRGPRPRDLVDVLKVEGWNATIGASGGFWRTETDEEIRKQWEESREHLSQLTRRRHRDAVRRKRRHVGPGRGENE